MKANILIIDDIGKNIQVLASILGQSDFAVSYALSGQQALDVVVEEDFDCILLDIMMPGMDGLEVCRRMKNLPGKENIPIIFLTARTDKADIINGFKAGAVDYLTKPFNAIELLARVNTHVQLKKIRDLLEKTNLELAAKNEHLEKLNAELQETLKKLETLEGIIPICSFCKKIRDDQGYWNQVDSYISKHSRALFSHGLCPECLKKHYPDL
jgi:DNA-binding response OmpR family regulator